MNQPINLNITNLKPSATLAINERSNALIESGKKVYKLGFGQSPFPVPQIVVTALKDNAHQKDYLPVKGLYALRRAVANYHTQKFDLTIEAEDVLIGPGSKELLFLTQMIYQGELLHYMLDGITLDNYCSQKVNTPRILILNYPSNPTGNSLSTKQLKEIAAIARKHKILILSDEIYGDVHHTGKHESIASYYPEGTIVSSGLSKWCGAGGWRLGTFVFPKELRWLLDKMAVVASETFTTTSAPIQYAAVKAYEGGVEIEEYLSLSRLILKRIAQAASSILINNKIYHPNPEGGFYLMPDFNFYKKALVALLPLSAFGMPEDFLGARLSYVDFDGEKALQLIKENPNAPAEALAPKVVEGIQLIVDWIK